MRAAWGGGGGGGGEEGGRGEGPRHKREGGNAGPWDGPASFPAGHRERGDEARRGESGCRRSSALGGQARGRPAGDTLEIWLYGCSGCIDSND